MNVSEICMQEVVTISSEANLQQAAILMNGKAVGCLVVVDSKRIPIGIVTDRDLTVKGLIKGLSPDCESVRSVMSENTVTISESADVFELIKLMKKEKVRRVVVTKHGTHEISGILSVDDVLSFLVKQISELSEVYQVNRSGGFNPDFTKMA